MAKIATTEKEKEPVIKKTAQEKKDEASKDKFDKALYDLEEKFGKGTVINGKDVKAEYEVVSTGSFNFDIATIVGGWVLGKLIEIYGGESAGKSTILLHCIANFQKKYKDPKDKFIFVNTEHALDVVYAKNLGVDMDRLHIMQPDTMEDMYNGLEPLIRTGRVRLVVIDSHTAAIPKAIVEGQVGEATMALAARFNSTALGKIKPLLDPNRCLMVGVAQLRSAIGSYGDPDKPTGGNAWKFYSDMRIKVSKTVDAAKELNKTKIKIVKSKVAPPFGEAEFTVGGGMGIDRLQELIEWAVEYKMIEYKPRGGWYIVGGDGTEGSGTNLHLADLKQFMTDNPQYATELEAEILKNITA